ncbi:MAG: protein kinase [Candidatus Krumholzibacteriota bacterium]|nr:protein kinase [Candidatus Krumholzibacteriota bacterium]
MKSNSKDDILKFDLRPGFMIAGKYEVVELLGRGWEGEVYRVREKMIGLDRAAKLFFPQRNSRNKTSNFYAKKLHKLRHCPILIQYHTQEKILFNGVYVTVLVSEYVEGELLTKFLKRQPGRRLTPFEGLHLLNELVIGLDVIHNSREYHGDLHDDNIIIRRVGLSFNIKLVDMFDWGAPKGENIREDVIDLIRIFYDSLGGAKTYPGHPKVIKDICCGLKKSLISRKFRNAGQLRRHLTTMEWQ